MPRVHKPIQAQLIEYVCDCGKGVYRLKYKTPYTSDCRFTWLHRCSHCVGGTETIEYRLLKNFALGVGFAILLTDLSVDDIDWAGSITEVTVVI